MITEKQWNKISSSFDGRIYQTWHRMKKRVKNISATSHIFNGTDLLDIGCNAGIMMMCVNPDKYTGLEVNPEYYDQAVVTIKHSRIENKEIINSSFLEYDDSDINSVLGCNVLYHLSEEEIIKLRSLLDRCRSFLFTVKRKDLNRTNNTYNFHIPENVVEYVKDFKPHIAEKSEYTMIWGIK